MIETAVVTCPYCGEVLSVTVDCSAGNQHYIEDCEVCCRPIEYRLHVNSDGDLLGLLVHRDDEC